MFMLIYFHASFASSIALYSIVLCIDEGSSHSAFDVYPSTPKLVAPSRTMFLGLLIYFTLCLEIIVEYVFHTFANMFGYKFYYNSCT